MSIQEQYRSILPPRLGSAYDELMRIRAGDKVELTKFNIHDVYNVAPAPETELPDNWTALKYSGPERVQESVKCFQHLADLKTLLGPTFPWYDPAKPGRPGFFVAGSFATPCYDYSIEKTTFWTMDENNKGVEHVFDFHVPGGRGDVDLFIAGQGDATDLAAESLVRSVLVSSEKNPFIRAKEVLVCKTDNCQRHFRLGIDGGYNGHKCACKCHGGVLGGGSTRPGRLFDVYDYVAKHVIGFTCKWLNIEVVTRVYSTPEKCPALFDLTYDGGVYMGGDTVGFLDISLYQHVRRILLSTPFSGSSTQELRHVKKIEAYGLDLVVPGLQWDANMPSQERGITVVRDVLRFRNAVNKDTGAISPDIDVMTKRFYSLLLSHLPKYRKVPSLKAVIGHFMEVPKTTTYSFVPGCSGFRLQHVDVAGDVVGPIILIDVPGSDIHVGAFSFTPPEEFVKLWCMNIEAPVAPARPLPDARSLKRASKAFSPKLRNIVTSFDIGAVVGATRVVIAPGPGDSIDLGFAFVLSDVECAQVWNFDFTAPGAPVIRCQSMTGLYQTGKSVCMGSQSHYHSEDGIAFSLSAMVTSLAERPALILEGVQEHVTSVGVLVPVAEFDDIVAAHKDTLSALEDERWILTFEVSTA